jgi:mevalonate kinase
VNTDSCAPTPFFDTRARGKLLLTGEYFVLDGARALAVPTRYGQSLRAEAASGSNAAAALFWESQGPGGVVWFSAEFALPALDLRKASDASVADTLKSILRACRTQQPVFLGGDQSYKVLTHNDFPREWGLGTSSTLIAALARWAGADAYRVLADTLGGSGYDLACAYAEGPIVYRLLDGRPVVETATFAPAFADQLYFVFLGKKQNSRLGIQRYRERVRGQAAWEAEVSQLTRAFLDAPTLTDLEMVISAHEHLVARTLDLERAKDLYFSDFWGEIKSLGAWGGDFVLATSARTEAETEHFFQEKGFSVCLPWRDVVFSNK